MRDWRTEPLERIANIRSSNVDKKSNPGELPVRLCNYMDVYSREYITQDIEFMEATATTAEIQTFGIERGDVMMTKDSETPDDIGIPAVVIDDVPKLVCGYHLALIKPNRAEVDSVYLAKQLALSDTARYYGRLANGSTRYGLSNRSIARTPIRLAPMPQQRRIAEILSTVDEAIEQTEALIAKTQQIKAGLMHDLFTRGVTANGELRPPHAEAPQLYKESPLGWIPKEWGISRLRECLLDNPTNGIYKPADKIGRGTLLVGQTSFTEERSVDLSLARRACVSADEMRRYSLAEDNLLVSRVFATVDGVGLPALVPELPEPAVYESNMMRLRVDPRSIDSRLLFEWLRGHHARRFIEGGANASNQSSINQQILNALPVVLPTLDEQARILAVIEAEDDCALVGRESLMKLRRLKAAMMRDLLTGQVSVSIADDSHGRGLRP